MTKYRYLLKKNRRNEHPEESQWRVSLAFGVSKGTVWNAYRFMGKEIGEKL